MSGEHANLGTELCDERFSERRLVEVDDILNHVVTERILYKAEGIVGDTRDEPTLLVTRSMIDAALKNAAPMTVSADVNTMVANCIKDELGVFRRQLVKTLLDDVVTIQVLDEVDNLVTKSIDNDLHMLGDRDKLNHLLEGTSTVLVQGNANHLCRCILDKGSAFIISAVLQELLAEIVAERIHHQLGDVRASLSPDLADLGRVSVLQLLLKEPAAMLVFAQSEDLSNKIIKRQIVEAGHGCKLLVECIQIASKMDLPSLSTARRWLMTRCCESRLLEGPGWYMGA